MPADAVKAEAEIEQDERGGNIVLNHVLSDAVCLHFSWFMHFDHCQRACTFARDS